jgi:hypothetical protein
MDARRSSESTARNREPILAVLRRVLPAQARVLEIASGAGEHAVFLAGALPGVIWQPSDPDADSRASIAAWIADAQATNVLAPRDIDVRRVDWTAGLACDAIVAINMIHIAPWEATLGLMQGAGALLGTDGVVFLYGPYRRGGAHTAPSNAAFDGWLKQRDPASGVRDLEAVVQAARDAGFALAEVVEMPANNLSLVLVKR